MTVLVAVTAAFVLILSPTHANAVPDIRLIRGAGAESHFVRLRYDAIVNELRGTDEILVDTATGRFSERVVAGPLSGRTGFDGARAWTADANGLAEIEDDPEDRSGTLAWAYAIACPPAQRPSVETLGRGRYGTVFRLRYPTLTRGIDATIDRNGRVSALVMHGGIDSTRLTVRAYARSGSLIVPMRMIARTFAGDVDERLRRVEVVSAVAQDAFSPPPGPYDWRLDGVARVPLVRRRFGYAIDVQAGNGALLRMQVDTGASLALSPGAAARSGLHPVGRGRTGGIGPDAMPVRYARVPSVRIGGAELRDQTAEIFPQVTGLDDETVDGTIGIELFERFAARLDFAHRTLSLARDASALHPRGTRLALTIAGGAPAVHGAFADVAGTMIVDTGSVAALDVYWPIVRDRDLLRRYGPGREVLGAGVGGLVMSRRVRIPELRLGTVRIPRLVADLDLTTQGAFADPSIVGDIGLGVLERFVTVIDVRRRAIYLDPVR